MYNNQDNNALIKISMNKFSLLIYKQTIQNITLLNLKHDATCRDIHTYMFVYFEI